MESPREEKATVGLTCFPQEATVSFELSLNNDFVFSATAVLAAGERTATTTFHLPVRELEQVCRRYNGHFEIGFVLTAPALSAAPLPFSSVFAYARFPWGTKHYLGPLCANEEKVASARMVAVVPASLDIVFQIDSCIPPSLLPPWPCEMLLKEHIKTILENDEFCGSVTSSHMQNLVRELPFYAASMRRTKRWSELVDFFAQFYHSWTCINYTTEEQRRLGLSELTPANEVRLVANRFRDTYLYGDLARERVKLRAMLHYRELVSPTEPSAAEEVTPGVPVDRVCTVALSKEKIQRLSLSKSFLTLNCVNYMQVLKQASARYCVLFSPLHPVQLDEFSPTKAVSDAFQFNHRKYVHAALT